MELYDSVKADDAMKKSKKHKKKRQAPQAPVDGVINSPGVVKDQIEELFGMCWEDIKKFLERLVQFNK